MAARKASPSSTSERIRTDLAVYYGEVLIYSCSLPVCADHFTSDVAHGLLVSTEDAEWIKEQQGCAMLGLTGDNSLIEVPSASGRNRARPRAAS